MNQKQMNRAEMLATTRAYLDANTSVWSSIPVINTIKPQLDDVLQSISEHQEAKEASQVFLGSNKTALKKAVAEKADILNDVLATYAAIEGNATLEQKADRSYSELYRLPNQEFVVVIKETIKLLEEHIEAMADYGMSPDQITDLKNAYDNYLAISGQPRLYKVATSQAVRALEDLFTQANELLTARMDRVMKRYKSADPNFYRGYLAARVIVDN
ncbi:MAG: hypothetical protein MJA31_11035 [Clostridia bacterium]|nr:hypothetical protein [Clostridia bacterium]